MSLCCNQANWFLGALAFVGVGVLGLAFSNGANREVGSEGSLTINQMKQVQEESKSAEGDKTVTNQEEKSIASFGAGCFWCVEAVFQELEGVISVKSGYTGGHVENPTYRQICTGTTGHAEICRIEYDPSKVSFEKLLEVFWATHDPTTLNRQGADSGTQYRSAIFYHNDEQKEAAERLMKKLDESGAFNDPIVTEITKATKYYPAEDYHQDYFKNNPTQGYCRAVIVPKMAKFRKVFKEDLKK